MAHERLTMEEIKEKYPNKWLFLTEHEFCNESGEALSAVIYFVSDTPEEVWDVDEKYHEEPRTGCSEVHWTGEIPSIVEIVRIS